MGNEGTIYLLKNIIIIIIIPKFIIIIIIKHLGPIKLSKIDILEIIKNIMVRGDHIKYYIYLKMGIYIIIIRYLLFLIFYLIIIIQI